MNKDRNEHEGRSSRRTFGSKSLVLILTCVLLIGGTIGGTLAWLTDTSEEVVNTFTESNIEITLAETVPAGKTAKMIPGWTISKDPTVKVLGGSEDCWLFVKITKSTSPDLDSYIAYKIADDGWRQVSSNSTETVIGRKVYSSDAVKEFNILIAGGYTDNMGTPDDTSDDCTITWQDNQVCVKPSVTEGMMSAISTQQPTLSFKAYAVQLKKNADTEFEADEAWARADALD